MTTTPPPAAESGLSANRTLEGRLEPEAITARSPEEAALTSLAVSMKRIADMLDGTALNIPAGFTTLFRGSDHA